MAASPVSQCLDIAEASLDVEALRQEFPTLERWTYLDVARKAPLPRCVEAATRAFFEDIYDSAGRRAFSMEAVDETRAALGDLLGVPASTLAFVKNTSEGLNLAVQSIPMQPGDNVVVGEFEHEAQIYPLRLLSEFQGVEIRVVPASEGRETPEALAARMDERTRLCAVSHVAFGNGSRIDLMALSAECRQRGVLLLSDAIQSVGMLATPLAELGPDIIVAGCHKGLLGLNGTAFLYCREDLIEALRPIFAGKYSVTSDRLAPGPVVFQIDARRFEYGNPNFLGITALGASIRMLDSIGLSAIEAHIRELTTALIAGATALGIEVRTPRDWNERAGIVSFRLPSNAKAIVDRLAAERIIVNAKDDHVRASVHFYNSHADLGRLLEALSSV
jgi:selenocysteine lyase/cysteine desulfurase